MSEPCSFRHRDYVKITLLGFAITALWQSLHSIILPQRLLDFVPESQKNTSLGLMTLTGLLLAMLVQPIAGAFSDRTTSKWGRRRPYILFGGAAAIMLIPGIGLANGFAALFTVYCLLQIVSNTAQGPYQALIPDLAPTHKRGLASGVKALLEIAGGAVMVLMAGMFINRYAAGRGSGWLWLVLGILMAGLLVTLILTLVLVKETPFAGTQKRESIFASLRRTAGEVYVRKDLVWYLASRLLVYMAFTTIQQFAFYYLQDVTGVKDPSAATAKFLVAAVVGMLISVWPAGYFADKVGRKQIVGGAAGLGALGIVFLAVFKDYNTMLWGAGIIGLAIGAFNSANWALATDMAPKGEEARYLGIANMATAGGAALARLVGPVIDYFNGRSHLLGYSVMLWACIAYFITGGLLVLKIKPPSVKTE
jgi:Na+/melibiose symporter-like transporter